LSERAKAAPFFFTWTAQNAARPLALIGGDGAWFETENDGRWLDLASFSYHVNVGHGHRRMMDAVARQARRLCVSHPSAVFPEKTALARRLLEMAPPGFDRVFFTLGGAEANENALKMARLFTGRHKLMSRYRSYHGATMGALTLSGDWRRPPLEPGLAGVVHALDCYCDRCPFGQQVETCRRECATHVDEMMGHEQGVAALFLEPIPGANGVLVPPDGYWPRIREACDRNGALLVADEVLTGFGRTGRWLAIEHFGGAPDLITVGKGLTGGYGTLGAVLVHERVSGHFDDNVLACGLTSYGHPLGIAAALEAFAVYEDEGLIENAARLEAPLKDGLGAIARDLGDRAVAVRGKGLLAALEIDAGPEDFARIGDALRRRKVYAALSPRAGTINVAPPLCISGAELEEGIGYVADAVREALS
jgi:taurine---2-oxoglutarate transaminase